MFVDRHKVSHKNSAMYGTVWSGRWGMLAFTSRIMCSQNIVLQLLLFTPHKCDIFFCLPPPLLKHCHYRNVILALIGWCTVDCFIRKPGYSFATLRIGGTSAGPRHMMTALSQPHTPSYLTYSPMTPTSIVLVFDVETGDASLAAKYRIRR